MPLTASAESIDDWPGAPVGAFSMVPVVGKSRPRRQSGIGRLHGARSLWRSSHPAARRCRVWPAGRPAVLVAKQCFCRDRSDGSEPASPHRHHSKAAAGRGVGRIRPNRVKSGDGGRKVLFHKMAPVASGAFRGQRGGWAGPAPLNADPEENRGPAAAVPNPVKSNKTPQVMARGAFFWGGGRRRGLPCGGSKMLL